MLNRRELGLKFENMAIDRLRIMGYEIIEHTSVEKEIAPYDIVAKKDGKLYFIEVKGRSGNCNNFLIRRDQMIAYSYIDNVFIFLINDNDFRFFNIIDKNNEGVLDGFVLSTSININELKFRRERINEALGRKSTGHLKILYSLGEKLIILFDKNEIEADKLKEGDCLDISDMVKQ